MYKKTDNYLLLQSFCVTKFGDSRLISHHCFSLETKMADEFIRGFYTRKKGLWTDVYEPKTIDELPIYNIKRKISDFSIILGNCFSTDNTGKRIVFIRGHYGCGKTSFVKVVSSELNFSIINFNFDEEYSDLDKNDKMSLHYINSDNFETTLRSFLKRVQLKCSSDKSKRLVILFDNVFLPEDCDNAFYRVINEYNSEKGYLLPIFIILDPGNERLCVLGDINRYMEFKLNCSRKSMEKVLKNICEREGITFNKNHINNIIQDKTDLRQVINNFQFSQRYITDSYENIPFFEAIGSILNQKNKLTPQQILDRSHIQPKTFSRQLFNNYLDFYRSTVDIMHVSEYFSLFDYCSNQGWNIDEFELWFAWILLGKVSTSNSSPRSPEFRPLKSGIRNVFQIEDRSNLPFVGWPEKFQDEQYARLEDVIFRPQKREYISHSVYKHVLTQREREEQNEILEMDPLEDDDSFGSSEF